MRHKYQGTAQDGTGRIIEDANITVYLDDGTTLATIYTAASGGTADSDSVVQSNAYGWFEFYVDDSEYMPSQKFDIVMSKTGYTSQTWESVKIIPDEPYYYYCDATATNQGAATSRADRSLKDLIDAIGTSVKATIILPHSGSGNTTTYVLGTAETVPSNINLKFENGALIQPAAGVTLTINGSLKAGLYQIFDCSLGGHILFGDGAVDGIRPEWYGGIGDDSTDCTAAFELANESAFANVVAYGEKQNIKLSQGVYRVTATSGNYAVTLNVPMVGEGANVSVIKNVGEGSALSITGVTGEIYYSRWKDFSVKGNASSEDGITLNVSAALLTAVGYSAFENVDSTHNGRHGLVHDASWATKYINCKFNYNGSLGVYLPGSGAYSQHNNVTFTNCDSRWNGGTTDNGANFLKGGVRISGAAVSVAWHGGVVESNNAWGFIIGEDSTYTVEEVVIDNIYSESHPSINAVAASVGGFLYASDKWGKIKVRDSYIAYGGALPGQTGYGFYINDASVKPGLGGFIDENNMVVPSPVAAQTAFPVRDYGIDLVDQQKTNVELITEVNNRDFSGSNNWVDGDFVANGGSFSATGGNLTIASTVTSYCYLPVEGIDDKVSFRYGRRYSIGFDARTSGVWSIRSSNEKVIIPNIKNGDNQRFEVVWADDNANKNLYVQLTGSGIGIFDNFTIKEIGRKNENQYSPVEKTTAVTLLIKELRTKIITGTHSAGATQAYTLPTGTSCDLWLSFEIYDSFDWTIINLSAAAVDTITLTATTGHTIVGNPIIQSAHSTTGGIYGNSAIFRTVKTGANTYVTYRIS